MTSCEACGNDYDKAFRVRMNGTDRVFDCFECAISALAPHCGNCGVPIVGHGVEADGGIFCCAHCASRQGETAVRDRT